MLTFAQTFLHMSTTVVQMPKLGESVMEATLTKWLVKVGDTITLDQPLVEIATDKVDSEVPSPFAGVLTKQLFSEGDVVKIGEAFAELNGGDASAEPQVQPASTASNKTEHIGSAEKSITSKLVDEPISSVGSSSGFLSPLVRTIIQKEGISEQELAQIQGSGLEGRITKEDILGYLKTRNVKGDSIQPIATPMAESKPVATSSATPSNPIPVASRPSVSVGGNDEIVEMDRMRKLIAAHMVMSKQVSPHVTSFVEADVTEMVKWRDRVKDDFFKKYGEKLTYTPIILEMVAQALREFPGVNASVDGDRIILRKNINIGMAAALPSGNLIVPVIKNADQMNLIGLTRTVNDLSSRAKMNKLSPDEISDGTYTVSNVGTFGNVMGTPIINQPQVAILAVGAIRKKPAVIETSDGDFIGIRHMMFLSHSYDHRVVDGALGGSFVKRVADLLENFDPQRPL
jgi:2-oxoglutarate dehydrogenase E2 component (dihydrolipoamide succinyltransferase)